MNATIDSTYQTLTRLLPPDLREPARGLLFGLGLARAPDVGWADVFQLIPSRDLPLLAMPAQGPCDEGTLATFQEAHHVACFHNVLVDRMADRQAAITPERERLAAHFLACWRRSLAEAMGEEGEARHAIERGLERWRRGVGLEQAAWAERVLSLARYGRIILLKLGWASIATECMLRPRVEALRLRSFRRAFALLASGMQCIDDAADSAEDEAVHGLGLPAALGFPAPALFTAGALLTRSASTHAARGGFDAFAHWLAHRADELERIRRRRIAPTNNLAGMVIASSLETVCHSASRPIRGDTGGTSSCGSST
jgi:hypothetical protein